MKKIICLLLCFWLPLFFSAASFASTSMRVSEAIQANDIVSSAPIMQADLQADKAMPEHCPMSMAKSMADHADKNGSGQDKTAHDKCQHCGFCVLLAFYLPGIVNNDPLTHPPLSAHIAWVPSSHFQPANQRPPISN